MLPAVGTILLIALFPLAWTVWESLHLHDLRMPWLGRPFIGLDNYIEALGDERFREALVHTLAFTVASVTLELTLGCVLALAMNRTFRGRGLVRAAILVPWAIPTVVAGCTTVFSVFVGSLCAYALARLRFRGKVPLLGLVLAVSGSAKVR